jgi:hypothetical protein
LKGPKRLIVKILKKGRPENGLVPNITMLQCGHTAKSWGKVYSYCGPCRKPRKCRWCKRVLKARESSRWCDDNPKMVRIPLPF